MSSYPGNIRPDAVKHAHRRKRFASTVPVTVAAAWLFGAPGAALESPTAQPAAIQAVQPNADIRIVALAATMPGVAKAAADDAANDGDDQDDPDDPGDTVAAADALWWSAAGHVIAGCRPVVNCPPSSAECDRRARMDDVASEAV